MYREKERKRKNKEKEKTEKRSKLSFGFDDEEEDQEEDDDENDDEGISDSKRSEEPESMWCLYFYYGTYALWPTGNGVKVMIKGSLLQNMCKVSCSENSLSLDTSQGFNVT